MRINPWIAAALAAVLVLAWEFRPASDPVWTSDELRQIESLWIGSLQPLPADPTNAVADDPRAAEFGHALFFDGRLSANGAISCATCHQPVRDFTDGLKTAVAIGRSRRNTPSVVGAAHSPWYYWDGRKDSLWSQALSPLEDPNEHGSNRMHVVRVVYSDPAYRERYEQLFGPMPDFADARFPVDAAPGGDVELNAAWTSLTVDDQTAVDRAFANIGKSIAAYERKLMPGTTRFDTYAAAVLGDDRRTRAAAITPDEASGLRIFIGKARCIECHNGPLFTNNEFHNTGILSSPGELPDRGRVDGLRQVKTDPFNCLGSHSDAGNIECAELEFAREGVELIGSLRTPSLRNLRHGAPFMHRGQLASLEEVIDHYDRAPLAMIGHNEAKPLSLSRRERSQLLAFLGTLFAAPAVEDRFLAPPAAGSEEPSGGGTD